MVSPYLPWQRRSNCMPYVLQHEASPLRLPTLHSGSSPALPFTYLGYLYEVHEDVQFVGKIYVHLKFTVYGHKHTQGVVTPIGAVVTAVTGSKIFDYHFCCLTTWPHRKRDLDRLTAHTWLLLPSLKIVLDCLTDTKNSPWPLDRFLTLVAAVTTAPMGMTTPRILQLVWGSLDQARPNYHLEWFHVKHLLSIFTADCLRHPIQMAGVETVWKLHTLIVMNSWYKVTCSFWLCIRMMCLSICAPSFVHTLYLPGYSTHR